jgi:hypothetical protein
MKNRAGNISVYLVAAILFSFGFIYMLRNSFMPYHSEALSLQWKDLHPALQFLLLALMRTTGGGFISLACAISFLQFKFSRDKVTWIPVLILFLGTISMLSATYAILLVSEHTPGKPPLVVALTGEVLLIAGFIFNRKYLKK